LPVPKQRIAGFNSVLFNYQSVEGDPVVEEIRGMPPRQHRLFPARGDPEVARRAGVDWAPLTEKELADEAEHLAYPESRPAIRAEVTALNGWRHSSTGGRVLIGAMFLTPLAGFELIRRKLRSA
jgi:hypothetical protein